jgi:hypothetical protein
MASGSREPVAQAAMRLKVGSKPATTKVRRGLGTVSPVKLYLSVRTHVFSGDPLAGPAAENAENMALRSPLLSDKIQIISMSNQSYAKL